MSNETEATIAEAPVAVAQIAESAAAASTSASNEASTSAPAPPESNTSSAPAPLSKNAQKRLLKAQAAAAIKLERRAKEREKKKEKRQRIREEHDPEEAKKLLKRKKAPEPKDQTPFASEVCVDLGWDDLMSDREITSLTSQIGFVYASNRGTLTPFSRLLFSGPGHVSGYAYSVESAQASGRKALEKPTQPGLGADVPLAKTLSGRKLGNAGWGKWRGCLRVAEGGLEGLVKKPVEAAAAEEAIGEADETPAEQQASSSTSAPARAEKTPTYKPEDIIYLTADTDDTLEVLETGKVYVIGGIVDRNRHKNLCSFKARKMGVRLARLPIDEQHLGDRALHPRTVLTVNQVFDILIGWVETRDWALALDRGLPHRKTLKDEPDAKRRKVDAASAEPDDEEEDDEADEGAGEQGREVGDGEPEAAEELDEEELYNQAQARARAAHVQADA